MIAGPGEKAIDVADMALPRLCSVCPVVLGAVSVLPPGVAGFKYWTTPGVMPVS